MPIQLHRKMVRENLLPVNKVSVQGRRERVDKGTMVCVKETTTFPKLSCLFVYLEPSGTMFFFLPHLVPIAGGLAFDWCASAFLWIGSCRPLWPCIYLSQVLTAPALKDLKSQWSIYILPQVFTLKPGLPCCLQKRNARSRNFRSMWGNSQIFAVPT